MKRSILMCCRTSRLIRVLLLVIAWLNKQVNEKLTLSASEFEKYGGSKQASQPLSDTSIDYKVCNVFDRVTSLKLWIDELNIMDFHGLYAT
jgi:hypothetical protein